MSQRTKSKQKRLTIILSTIFFIAIMAGLGPGLALINPDPADPNARFIIFGLPLIYVWAVFWFIVQASVVVVAYFCLWGKDTEDKK